MKKTLLFIFLIALMASCNKESKLAYKTKMSENEAKMDQLEEDTKLNSSNRPKGAVPSDIGFEEMAIERKKHTWKDLDRYYQNIILIEHSDKDYTNNLKNMAFFHLIEGYKMNEKADLKTVEFYINEQANIPYLAQPKMLSLCLDRMKGHWEESRIVELAENVRQKHITSVQERFANKPDVVKKKTDEYNQYLTYSKD
jgi:hypothetical protein